MYESYDRHLNIFWQYNGNPYLEDNITRALINTLSLTNDNLRLEIINFFLESLGEEKIVNDVQITFDLQNPYIKNIKDLNCKKLLIGLKQYALQKQLLVFCYMELPWFGKDMMMKDFSQLFSLL